MTQEAKRRATRTGGIIAVVLAVAGGIYALRSPLQGTGRALLDTPSRAEVRDAIRDTMGGHLMGDRIWRDSISTQVFAIRCNVDSVFHSRYYAECTYRVRVRP